MAGGVVTDVDAVEAVPEAPTCDDCGHLSESHCTVCKHCHAPPKRGVWSCGCPKFRTTKVAVDA